MNSEFQILFSRYNLIGLRWWQTDRQITLIKVFENNIQLIIFYIAQKWDYKYIHSIWFWNFFANIKAWVIPRVMLPQGRKWKIDDVKIITRALFTILKTMGWLFSHAKASSDRFIKQPLCRMHFHFPNTQESGFAIKPSPPVYKYSKIARSSPSILWTNIKCHI